MPLRPGNTTVDCDDVLRVASFWSAALGRPLDPRRGARFASIGTADPERVDLAWYFAKVPEPKAAKNRVHLDLFDPNPSVVDDLVRLGATVVGEHEVPGGSHRWTVLQDPEGKRVRVAARPFTGWG
jgi:hypothetical protein